MSTTSSSTWLMLRPSDIYFTQDTVANRFSVGHPCPLEETLYQLVTGKLQVTDIDRIVVTHRPTDGKFWVVYGNRRLYLYRLLEKYGHLTTIPVREVVPYSSFKINKFTTKNGGKSARVRGSPSVVKRLEDIVVRRSVHPVPTKLLQRAPDDWDAYDLQNATAPNELDAIRNAMAPDNWDAIRDATAPDNWDAIQDATAPDNWNACDTQKAIDAYDRQNDFEYEERMERAYWEEKEQKISKEVEDTQGSLLKDTFMIAGFCTVAYVGYYVGKRILHYYRVKRW